jgi:hypothetical protein
VLFVVAIKARLAADSGGRLLFQLSRYRYGMLCCRCAMFGVVVDINDISYGLVCKCR